MAEIELSDRSELRIDVQAKGAVDARQIARVLTALDRSFARYALNEYGIRNAHLRIARTGTGSWWAILTTAKEIYDLSVEYPDMVPIFAQNLDVAMQAVIVGQQEPIETARYARDLLRDLAKAGRRLGAEAIEIASLTKVVIAAAYYEVLEQQDEAIYPAPRLSIEVPSRPMLTDRNAVLEAAERAERSQLVGTVFKVAGEWYVRAEGMFGVLIPLKMTVQPKLAAEDGEVYEIEGTLLRSPQGSPIGIEVRQVRYVR